MKAIRMARAVAVAAFALALTAVAGCGHQVAPGAGGSPTPQASSSPTSTQPSTPSPSSSTPSSSARPTLPAETVVSSGVVYPWHWPNDGNRPGSIQHHYPVPPVPQLIAIRAGDHENEAGERHYNRMSFTFTTTFPSYEFAYVSSLRADASGRPIPLPGNGVLRVIFRQAQAHTSSGASSVATRPPARLDCGRMVGWAMAGDFEGVLTYGIGIAWPNPQSNPQIPVRVSEVGKITASGQHLYVVAIDVAAG